MGESIRRRDHWTSPASCSAPEIHRRNLHHCHGQRSRTFIQPPLVQKDQRSLEIRRSEPRNQMVRVRFRYVNILSLLSLSSSSVSTYAPPPTFEKKNSPTNLYHVQHYRQSLCNRPRPSRSRRRSSSREELSSPSKRCA